jgi:hypothetical protein
MIALRRAVVICEWILISLFVFAFVMLLPDYAGEHFMPLVF